MALFRRTCSRMTRFWIGFVLYYLLGLKMDYFILLFRGGVLMLTLSSS